MKHAREIKVAILAIVCAFLLFFGLHFLKGVNIFSPVHRYVGIYENVGGLTEQAPVYIRGYKVGQVEHIYYDFTQEQAFRVTVSIDRDIDLPEGSSMLLISDGMLGGKAISIEVPVTANPVYIASGDEIPAAVQQGLMDKIENELLAKVDSLVASVDELVGTVQSQIAGGHLQKALANVERISDDLSVSANDIRHITHDQLPTIITNADTLMADAKIVVQDVKSADIQGIAQRVDNVLDTVQTILTTKEGTLGLLLNDKSLYTHIDSTVVSVDSLVTDLKANPKRYVHFSLFGAKDKKKKKK